MPIKINLLAEEQVAEEMRRKDPFKRTIVAAAAVVGVVLIYAVINILSAGSATKAQAVVQAEYDALAPEEKATKELLMETGTLENNLAALHRLATNRFMWSAPLEALQYCIVDGIVVSRIETTQSYAVTPAKIPRPNTQEKYIPAKSVENISIKIYATDSLDSYRKFIQQVGNHEYFKANLKERGGVKLHERTAPQVKQSDPWTVAVICSYPETIREE